MKLPFGDRAAVEEAKLLGYLLNPSHPVGRNHAWMFRQLLGIELANADVLKAALLKAAGEVECESESETPFGRKYVMRFSLAGPKGSRPVVAVWLLEMRSKRPRLVTCYPE